MKRIVDKYCYLIGYIVMVLAFVATCYSAIINHIPVR